MSKFELPALPWGDKEIKFLLANQPELDAKTREKLGLIPLEKVVETVVPAYEAAIPEMVEAEKRGAELKQKAADEKLATEVDKG